MKYSGVFYLMKSPGMSEREWKRESFLRLARTLPLLRRTTKRFIISLSSLADPEIDSENVNIGLLCVIIFNMRTIAFR